MATTRFEFMSQEWIAMARDVITRATAGRDPGGGRFTLCEEFTNPPEHLKREGEDTIGFCVRVADSRIEVDDRPAGDADCTIISDYADALAIARDPEMAAADPEVIAERIAEGRVRIVGDASAAPPVLGDLDLHRRIAAHTA